MQHGIVYILKFEPQFWHARYYVGWCNKRGLMNRLRQHRTGAGAHITRGAVEKNHRLVLVMDFPGTREDERAIKKRRNTPRFVDMLSKLGLLNDQRESVTRRADNVTRSARNKELTYYDDCEDEMGRIDLSGIDLKSLIERDTGQKLTKESKCYVGSCPFCADGKDRFVVWPQKWWCRRCNKSGDAINYVMYRQNITFQEACKMLGLNLPGRQPNTRTVNPALSRHDQPANSIQIAPERESPALSDPAWRNAAALFAEECHLRLLRAAPDPLAYLMQRGIEMESITDHAIGYNHKDRTLHWGKTKVFVPQGIVFPWYGDKQEITRVNVRCDHGPDKYKLVTGSAQEFYLGWRLLPGSSVIIVEGEIDALTIAQAYRWHPLVAPVATGSVTHGRTQRLIARLASAKSIRVAFDSDQAGAAASTFWEKAIKGVIKLKTPSPHKDVNALFCATMSDPENDGKPAHGYQAVRVWIEGKK